MGLADDRRKNRSTVALIVLTALAGLAVICCGVGAILLPPAVQQAREARRRQQATENLRQIGLALENYHQEYARPVAPTGTLSQTRIRELAVRFKDEWLKEHPDEKDGEATISNVEKTTNGWRVTFDSMTLPGETEGESGQYLHVYISADGTSIEVVRSTPQKEGASVRSRRR